MIASPERCIVCGSRPRALFRRGDLSVVRCPACGLEWLSPFPEEAAAGTMYGESYLRRWGIDGPEALARVRAMKESSYRSFLREIQRHRAGGRLLDVGCALGFLLGVAREEGFDPYGMDLNPSAIEIARREFGDRAQAGPLGPATFPGLRFDVITLIDVLEHAPDPGALLDLLRERLAPGGVIAAVLPNAASLTRRILGRRWPHYACEHLWYWSPANLRRFLQDRGWIVRALRTGIRKTYTARYLHAYSACLGGWLPPGLGILGNMRLRIPTGEMMAVVTPVSSPLAAGDSLGR